jgi:hypothetical protein
MKMKASIIRAFTAVFIAATLIIEACSKKTEETAPEVQKGETQIPSSTTGPVTLKVKADIYGRVFHMFTNKPLEDTTVIALGAEKVQTKTDSQGYFVLKGVPVLVSSVLVYSQAGSYVTSLTLAQSTYNIPVPIIFEHREKKEVALRIEEGNLDFVRTIQNVVVTVDFEKIVGQSIAYEVQPVNAGNIQMRPFVPSFKGKVLKKDGSGLKDATVMIADLVGAVPDAEFEFAITKTGEDGMFEFNLLHQIPSANGLQLIVFPFSSTETQKITDYGITYEYDTAFDGAVDLAPSFAGVSNLIEIGADGKLVQTRLYVISLKDRASDLRLIWSSIRNGDTVYQDSISEILLLFNRPVDVSTLEIRLIYPTGIVVGVTGIDTTKNPLIKVTLPKLDPNPYILRIAARDASGGGTGPIPLSFIQIAFDVYNPNLPVLACITPSVHVGSGSVYKVDDDEIIYGPSNNIQAYNYPSNAVWINWLPNPDASGYRIYARDTKGFKGGTVEWRDITPAAINNEGDIVKAQVNLTPFNKQDSGFTGPWLGGNEVKILVCPLNFNGVGANPKDFEAQALSLKDNIGPRVQASGFNGVFYDSSFIVTYREPLNFTEGIVVSRVSGYADVLSAVINDNIANQISITLTPRIKKKLAQDANQNDQIIVLDDVSDLFVGGQIKIDPQTPLEEVRTIQAIDLDTKTIVLNAGLTYSHSANAPVWFVGPSGAGTTKYVDSLQENISTTLQRIVVDRTGGLVVGNELLIGDEVVKVDALDGTYGIRLKAINTPDPVTLRAVYPSGTKVDRVFRQGTYTSSATSQTLASTTLASPAVANTPTIKVNSLSNISTGDRIVIEGENNVFTVLSIDPDSNTIVLNANLSFSHPAGEKVYEVEADDGLLADSNDADAACNTTFSNPAAAGETKITLTDASDVQVGDFLLLRRAAAPNFEEIVKVVGVSGNTVSVSKPIFGNYNAGDSVREVVLVKDTRVNVKLLAAYPMIRVGNANQLKINGTVRIDDGTLTQDAIVKSIIDGALLGLGGSFISVVPSGNVFSKDFQANSSKVTSSDVREADILSVDVKDTSGNSSTTVDINSNGKPENKLRGDGQVVE